MTLEDCVLRAESGQLRIEDCADGAEDGATGLEERMNAIARRVALRYINGERSFTDCHRAMDTLFRVMSTRFHLPELAFSVFFAFCAGNTTADRWNTRPLLLKFLAQFPVPATEVVPC